MAGPSIDKEHALVAVEVAVERSHFFFCEHNKNALLYLESKCAIGKNADGKLLGEGLCASWYFAW